MYTYSGCVAYMFMCVCKYACGRVHRYVVFIQYLPQLLSTLCFQTDSLTEFGMHVLIEVDWLVNEIQSSNCPSLPSPGIKGVCHHAYLLCVCWIPRTIRWSCLLNEHFTKWTISSEHPGELWSHNQHLSLFPWLFEWKLFKADTSRN